MDRVRKQVGIPLGDDFFVNREIGIGLLDSGVFPHKDLKNSLVLQKDFLYGKAGFYDDFGHGTHVAGIISGSGECSNGKYRGIAPGVKIYVGKILNKHGDGTMEHLLQGMEWLFENRKQFQLKVVNISVGLFKVSDLQQERKIEKEYLQRVYQLCKTFYEEGILIVVAAGNNGPDIESLSALGDNPYVFAVGCHDGDFKLGNKKMCKDYSGTGPGKFCKCKPDIVAPGTWILSCSHKGDFYARKSGTSMSAPIVAGAAVLAFSNNDKLTPGGLMERMIKTATDLGESIVKQGSGMLNINGLLT